tara:strand:- start:354 stop:1877 length:1524 start_codon:yes stop_codon:yes gene_type:complete
MAIVQQYILSPISESFVLTFANTTANSSLYTGSVDVDKFGNIYAAIWDFDEANILKIEPSGAVVWKKRITDVRDSNRWDEVKVDEASGDVYCVGWSYGNITSNQHLQYQCLVAKYNSSGVRQWAKILGDMWSVAQNGFSYSEQENIMGRIMSADSNGIKFRLFKENACGPGFTDIFESAYIVINSSGSLITQRMTSDFSSETTPSNNCQYNNQYSDRFMTYGYGCMTTGGGHFAGGAYKGVSYYQGTGDKYGVIAKFNSSGNLVWNKKFNADSANDLTYFRGMDSDSNDNVYAFTNEFILKFNTSGTLQWRRKLSSSNYTQIRAIRLDPDDEDGIYVMGLVQISGTHSWGTDEQVRHITKYNSSGTLQWQRVIAGFHIGFYDFLIKDKFIYIYGQTSGGTNGKVDVVILKIPTSGNLAGVITHDSDTFTVRNGGDNGNFDIYISGGTSTGMTSAVNPSYHNLSDFTGRQNHDGNIGYVNATNHNDGSAFGDSNSNVICTKTSLGYYS